jgi:beta-phosphoglucomutase family hydrolase
LNFTANADVQGLIFDADGTLIDTMPLHYLAWQETVQVEGGHFPEQLFYDLAGVPSDKIAEILNETFGYQLDPKQTAVNKEHLFLEKYLAKARPIEAVLAIATAYKGRLPLAVATGGVSHVVNLALKNIGLEHFFDAIVTSEDVRHGKPAPDTFLEAAHRLKVEPRHCVVFEDSDLGLEGARRAGMTAIDVRPWLKGI